MRKVPTESAPAIYLFFYFLSFIYLFVIYLFIYVCVIYLYLFIYLFIYLLEPFWFSRLFSICCFRVTAFIYLFIYLSRPIHLFIYLSISDLSILFQIYLFIDLWLFIINRFQSYRLIDYLIFDLQPSGPGHLFPLHDSCSPGFRTRIVARWRFNINHLTIQPRFIYFFVFRNVKKKYIFYLKRVFSALL